MIIQVNQCVMGYVFYMKRKHHLKIPSPIFPHPAESGERGDSEDGRDAEQKSSSVYRQHRGGF